MALVTDVIMCLRGLKVKREHNTENTQFAGGFCEVCELPPEQFTTDCLGSVVPDVYKDLVVWGGLDYVAGEWVRIDK